MPPDPGNSANGRKFPEGAALALQLLGAFIVLQLWRPLLNGPRLDERAELDGSPTWLLLAGALVASWISSAVAYTRGAFVAAGYIRSACRVLTSLLVGAPCVHAGMVLLGAPLLRASWETLSCSLFLATLTWQPVCAVCHSPWEACLKELSGERAASRAERGAVLPALWCLFGAWLGAIPTCLDWNQPWQLWPLTVALGGLGGYAVGTLVAGACLARETTSSDRHER